MPPLFSSLLRYLAAILCVAAVTFVCSEVLAANGATAGFFYLVLILLIASLWGFRVSILASVVAMLCYNYFFLPPVGQFTIADPQNWVALFAFLAAALVAGHLSNRAKSQTMEARRRQQDTEQLYALSRAILLTDLDQPIGAQAAQHIAQIFGASAVVLFDAKNGLTFLGGPAEIPGIEPTLKQVVLQGAPHHDTANGVDIWPILLGGRAIGALAAAGIRLPDSVVQAMLNIVAIALERVSTEEAANKAEIARQNEEFKSMLLDAIAHEFKTPLTSIKAASTWLLGEEDASRAAQREMITVIDEETDRLSLLVTEAVKMSQIDAGKLKLDRVAVAPETLLKSAVATFMGRGDHRIAGLDGLRGLPEVYVDLELISLALRQIIDNGLKYSPPSGQISVSAELSQDRVLIRISDEGPGIPERDREKIFDKYFRRANSRDKVPGSGLGLHIAREIVRAHRGDVWMEPGPSGGSQFCITLPQPDETRP